MATNVMSAKTNGLAKMAKYTDFLVAAGLVAVVGMMIVPMPTWMLDVLLTLNVSMALTVLLVAIYTVKPLEFSSFPSLLLVATLFRLGLSIAGTRALLLNADAGAVVGAFGTVVVGGNYVVGLVVFAIILIVQFSVITNGTVRTAEVAARFTLDAMPGKQMAIDADLNAGIIDDQEALRRRAYITKEADFYGAMDGASKFVKGDAMAAIIMILVNIIGGLLVGVLQRHMDLMNAVQTYILLTIGIGLVTQIPALLISTAAGLMVTKAASEGDVGNDLTAQILSQPKPLMITGALCGVLMLVNGIPKAPFIIIGLACVALAQALKKQAKVRPTNEDTVVEAPVIPATMTELLTVDPIEVELGYGLIALADPKQGGDLLDRVTAVRRQSAVELGMLIPAIRVRDNMQLKPNMYSIKLRGVAVAQGEIYVGHLLAMDPGTATTQLQGIDTVEPAFGLPATWIADMQRAEAEMAGFTVVDPPSVMITHLTETLRRHAAEILTRQDTQELIDAVKETSPAVVNELIPEVLTLGDVQKVLQNLLTERVSIRDMSGILEALSDAGRFVKDADLLTEHVRAGLARQITAQYQTADGTVHVFTLDPVLEQSIAEGIRQTEVGMQLVLEPTAVQQILNGVRTQVERMAAMGYQPVALCSPRTRLHFRRLAERMLPTICVLSYNELATGAKLETVGMVTLENEDVEDQILQYA